MGEASKTAKQIILILYISLQSVSLSAVCCCASSAPVLSLVCRVYNSSVSRRLDLSLSICYICRIVGAWSCVVSRGRATSAPEPDR